MECSSCKKPTPWAFELVEDVKGEGPTKRHLCFPCIQELGDKIMRPKPFEGDARESFRG